MKTDTDTDGSITDGELDQEEAQLRAEAEKIDPVRATDSEVPEVPSEAEERASARGEQPPAPKQRPAGDKKADATGAIKPEASKAKADTAPKPDASAKDKQTPQQQQPKVGTTPADDKSQSKFQMERARLDRTWKEVKAERDAIAREREQLAAERRAAQQQQQARPPEPKKPATDAQGYTAEDYDTVAKDLEGEGKMDLAAAARAKAKALRDTDAADKGGNGSPATRERFTPEETQAMTRQWQTNLQKLGSENPELIQEGTPLRTRVAQLLQAKPLLHMSGDGIVYAVELAKTELKAARVDELEAKNAELEKEIQRLSELTSLPSGDATPTAATKRFDELNIDEQEAALREDAAGQLAG